MKRVDELQGSIKEVIDLIREKLLRRREKPFQLIELAKDLSKQPFGLPFGAMPIFIAFALQKDVEKLVWTGGGVAAKNICEGITDQGVGVRFGDFTTYQLNILEVLKSAIEKIEDEKHDWERNLHDSGRQAIDILRAYIKAIPSDIIKSTKLDKRLRELCEAVKAIGFTPHEVVEKLAFIIDANKQLNGANPPHQVMIVSRDLLVNILNDAKRVEDETRFEIIKFVKEVIPPGDSATAWKEQLENLHKIGGLGVDAAKILAVRPLNDSAYILMVEKAANSTLDKLSEIQIGFAISKIKQLMDTASSLTLNGNDEETGEDETEGDDETNGVGASGNSSLNTENWDDASKWQSEVRTLIARVNADSGAPKDEVVKFLHDMIVQVQVGISNG